MLASFNTSMMSLILEVVLTISVPTWSLDYYNRVADSACCLQDLGTLLRTQLGRSN